MLLLILWAIVASLAVAEALIVLFLIRSRGTLVAMAGEVITLQQHARDAAEMAGKVSTVSGRLAVVERRLFEQCRAEDEAPAGKLLRFEVAGGRAR